MNQIELKYLTDKRLSHIARSLYAFCIKPQFEQNRTKIDLVAIVNYLNNQSSMFRTAADYETATLVLRELEDLGLVCRTDRDAPWHGSEFTLPYFVNENENVPEQAFAMTVSWKPGPNFKDACFLCGLEDPTYEDADLKAFTSYWCTHLEQRNQRAWERAFAQRLLKKRIPRIFVKNEAQSGSSAQISFNAAENRNAAAKSEAVSQSEQEKVLSELNSLFK